MGSKCGMGTGLRRPLYWLDRSQLGLACVAGMQSQSAEPCIAAAQVLFCNVGNPGIGGQR